MHDQHFPFVCKNFFLPDCPVYFLSDIHVCNPHLSMRLTSTTKVPIVSYCTYTLDLTFQPGPLHKALSAVFYNDSAAWSTGTAATNL